jgi:hypothetical protein
LTAASKFCPACGNPVPPEPVIQTYAPPAAPSPGGPMPGYAPPASMPGAAPANPTAPKSTNGLAIASMVLGILWVYWIGSILALIFGYVAKGQINASGGQQGGRGMAIAGIVLGWVGIVFLCLGIVAFLMGATKQ